LPIGLAASLALEAQEQGAERRRRSMSDSDDRHSEHDMDRAESESADRTDDTDSDGGDGTEGDARKGSASEPGGGDTAREGVVPFDKESRLSEVDDELP
jgi:hypothetical protein